MEDRFRCREGTVGRAFLDEDKDFGEAFNDNLRSALRRQRPYDEACAMSLACDLTSSTGY